MSNRGLTGFERVGALGLSLVMGLVASAAWGQVASDLVCDGCVGKGDIADKAVNARKIKSNSIFSTKIVDRSIQGIDLGLGEIGTKEIADGAVDTAKLADGAVTAPKLAEDAVFGRILVVRADPADPLGNCDELKATLAGITDNGADNRYTIWLESGVYDCDTTSVQMKPYVDIRGSGPTATLIVGSPDTGSNGLIGLVIAASDAEISSLTVRKTGDESFAAAILSDHTNIRISNLIAEAVGGPLNGGYAISIGGGAPRLWNVTATAQVAGSFRGARGVNVSRDADVTLVNVTASATGGSDTSSAGLWVDDSTATAQDSVFKGDVRALEPRFGAKVRLVATQLDGSLRDGGTLFCLASYDGEFTPLDRTCDPIP